MDIPNTCSRYILHMYIFLVFFNIPYVVAAGDRYPYIIFWRSIGSWDILILV